MATRSSATSWVRPRQRRGRTVYQATVRWPSGKTESQTFDRKTGPNGANQWIADRLASRKPAAAGTHANITVDAAWSLRMERAAGLPVETRDRYADTYRLWIGPFLGDRLVRDLDEDALAPWITAMRSAGATNATVRKAVETVRPVFVWAARRNIGVNATRGLLADVPKAPHVRPALTVDEVLALAGAVRERYRALVYTLGFVGLRIGEAVALRVSDFDATAGTVRIAKHAVVARGGVAVRQATKTGHTRTVPLPAVVTAELVAHLERSYGPTWRWRRDALLFPNRPGTVRSQQIIDAKNLLRRELRPAAISAGIRHPDGAVDAKGRPVPFVTHWLRHTAAHLAIQGGADVVAVQNMLGHTTPTVTMNTYLGWFNAQERRAAAAVDAMVDRAMATRAAGG